MSPEHGKLARRSEAMRPGRGVGGSRKRVSYTARLENEEMSHRPESEEVASCSTRLQLRSVQCGLCHVIIVKGFSDVHN